VTGSLDVELTRKCNLRCDYCFVGWSRDWTSQMPYAVAAEVVTEGAGLFPILHLTGGEPFAYRHLFDLVDLGLRLGYEEILINTNGTLVTDDVADCIAARGDRMHISVSLDGPEGVHDRVRGAGRFQEAANAIDGLLARGVRVTLMCVVTPAVLPVLLDFVVAMHDAHDKIVGVTLFPVGVGPQGTQKPGAKLHPLTPAELRELALGVALLYHGGYRVGVAAYPVINPLLRALGYPQSQLYQCTAGRGRVCVHADLTVSTCHPVKDAVYGTWQRGLLRRLDEFPAHAKMAHRDFDGCRTCSEQEACGHCRAYVTASGADLYGNDQICHDVLMPGMGPVPVPMPQLRRAQHP
jgi:MoaA/NifB/PqqE/SkfB family radical SAM enzyme